MAWGTIVLSGLFSVSAAAVLAVRYQAPQAGIVVAAALFAPAIVAFRALRSGRWSDGFTAGCVQGIVLVAALCIVAFPVVGPYHSAKDVAIEAVRARYAEEPLVSYRFFHHTLHYYTGYRITEDLGTPESLSAFAAAHPRFLAVVPAARLGDLTNQGLTYTSLAVRGPLTLVRVGAETRR